MIPTRAVFSGRIAARALSLVMEWSSLHEQELLSLWEKARNLEGLHKIDPLP